MNLQIFLASLTLLGHIVLIFGILAYFVSPNVKDYLRKHVSNYGYLISFFIALFSVLGSLYFSEVIGWEPCVLCWYQRIAMYPLVIIFALGVWKQDLSARIYGLAIAAIGLVISIYQIYLQILTSFGQSLSGFCSTVGAINCSEIYMLEFGYITFPVMAATAFVFIILIQLIRPVIQ